MENSNNIDLVAELKTHLDSMTSEEIEKEWDELKEYNFGPTVEEYLNMIGYYNTIEEPSKIEKQ